MNAAAGLFCFPWQVSKYNRFLKMLWKLRERKKKKNWNKDFVVGFFTHPSIILQKKLKTSITAFIKNIDQAAMHPVALFIRKNSWTMSRLHGKNLSFSRYNVAYRRSSLHNIFQTHRHSSLLITCKPSPQWQKDLVLMNHCPWAS
jgi:hypothetical protein